MIHKALLLIDDLKLYYIFEIIQSTPVRFELTRATLNTLAVYLLDHSDIVPFY